MSKIIERFTFLAFLLCIFFYAPAQIAVGGSTTPDSSRAIADINAPDKGVLIPRMTSTERTAIGTPAAGLLVFDITTSTFWYYEGSLWTEIIDRSNVEPVGMIAAFATSTLPAGWLALDGQSIPAASYPQLAIVNPSFVSGANLVLPDYRGLFLRGSGTNTDGIGTPAPATPGVVSLFTTARPATPFTTSGSGAHTHSITTNSTGAHTHTYADRGAAAVGFTYTGSNNPISSNTSPTKVTGSSGAHTHTVTLDAAGAHTHSVTSGGDAETRPAVISIVWAIKASN